MWDQFRGHYEAEYQIMLSYAENISIQQISRRQINGGFDLMEGLDGFWKTCKQTPLSTLTAQQ